MNILRTVFILSIVLLCTLVIWADDTGQLHVGPETVLPLQDVQIQIADVNTLCTVQVTTPLGHVQTFNAAITEHMVSATYRPSYLVGTYQVQATVDGITTEIDTFVVSPVQSGIGIAIVAFSADPARYIPGQNLTFRFDLTDSEMNPLSGFSKEVSDTRYESDSGRLSILRRIVGVDLDGVMTARIFVYFDASGSWSNIYAGTSIEIGLYYKDGSPLPTDFELVPGTENDSSGALSSQIIQVDGTPYFQTTVNTGFAGADKISYVDVTIPADRNLSDVIFSVNSISYSYNTGWNDRIYIAEHYRDTSGSPMNMTTGTPFAGLGLFPVFLPLIPNENGIVFFSAHGDYIDRPHINDGQISEQNGMYTNVWQWEDYVDSSASFQVYADKWGYDQHALSPVIEITMDPAQSQQSLVIEDWSVSPETYFPLQTNTYAFTARDTAGNLVQGLTDSITDPMPDSDSGSMLLRRIIREVFQDGSIRAQLQVYFDTTGRWSDIYAGTQVVLSLYNKDGMTPLTNDISLTTGFENDGGLLSSTLVDNVWTVEVTGTIVGQDRIAYLEFDIPAQRSVSDVIFSVDSIKYSHNPSWADTIVIGGQTLPQSQFTYNLNRQVELTTGAVFPGLGQFPIRLTLNPNPNGFVVFSFHSPDLPELNLADGVIREENGRYTNSFLWNDHIITSAEVFPYIDKWSYAGHAMGNPVTVQFNDEPRELALRDFMLDQRGYSKNDTRQFTGKILDGLANPVAGFRLNDPIPNSTSGQVSIVTRNAYTNTAGNNVMHLLLHFDTTGSWSDIYAGTEFELSVYGTDGKNGLSQDIPITIGHVDPNEFTSELIEDDGVLHWKIHVERTLNGIDREVFLAFEFPDGTSSSQVIFSVDHIQYSANTGWADTLRIHNVSVPMSQFPRNYAGQYEFDKGDRFGSLGRFPLYLSLNPGIGSIFVKMQSTEDVPYTGSLLDNNGQYTYSHTFDDLWGLDFQTCLCIARYGYFNNQYLCSDAIDLFFTSEPRYLGGLNDQPIMLGEIWQKDLSEFFFVEPDYSSVLYSASDPNLTMEGNIATFTPINTDDTIRDLIITATSTIDPNKVVSSSPFTLWAANCINSHDCQDDSGLAAACIEYACEYYEMESSYAKHPQGVDLSILNQNVQMSTVFPVPGEEVTLCATVENTGTTNIFDVATSFYLDDIDSAPIDVNEVVVLPTTYLDLPFRQHDACIHWTIPADLRGAHRIWVTVSGRYPLEMEEDMLGNNYATLDFYVVDPQADAPVYDLPGSCPAGSIPLDGIAPPPTEAGIPGPPDSCRTIEVLIPVKVKVCEDELICGPVMGYELGYWNTIYWPSWSGYCQEFGVPQEFFTDFIRTYERLVGLGSQGAMSSLPSLNDYPGLLKPPDGWSDGWLPCHPEPTLFWYILYEPGVLQPGCGGLCPVSAWDCGEGVHFHPRFDSPLYNAYEFKTYGGARHVTRCRTEGDWIRVPYRICDPEDDHGGPPPINIPWNPFQGGPGSGDGGGSGSGDGNPPGYSGRGLGSGGGGSGGGGGSPIRFEIATPVNEDGNRLPVDCYFCSTGTKVSTSANDYIHCVPLSGGPETGVPLRYGWNLLSPSIAPTEEDTDRNIPLQTGWNLFGYSQNEPLSWAYAKVEKNGQVWTVDQAHAAGWIQKVIYYFDEHDQVYKFIPFDDVALRNNHSYWLFAYEPDLTLILPSVGGSLAQTCYAWANARVTDGQQYLTVYEAEAADWLDATAYYVDETDQSYKPVGEIDSVCAWDGYWLWSRRDDLRLLTYDPPAPIQYANIVPTQEPILPPDGSLDQSDALGILVGQTAPDLTLRSVSGSTVRLWDQRGQDILLVFGTPRCPHCASKVEMLNKIDSEADRGGMRVLFVALGADKETAYRFVQRNQIRFQVLPDPYRITGGRYRIHSVPTAFVIDPEGVVRYSGVQDGQIIWNLLSGEPIRVVH